VYALAQKIEKIRGKRQSLTKRGKGRPCFFSETKKMKKRKRIKMVFFETKKIAGKGKRITPKK
jgi:hypothetical protein